MDGRRWGQRRLGRYGQELVAGYQLCAGHPLTLARAWTEWVQSSFLLGLSARLLARLVAGEMRLHSIQSSQGCISLEFHGKHRTDHWSWCDSLFMAPPAWLQLYYVTKVKALFAIMP